MPIGLQTPIKGHTGNGVTTTFAYNFGILAAADLKVQVAGVVVTTGYTVTGVGNRAGGTVVFSAAPASGAAVLFYRSVSRDRATDYQTNGDLRAEVLDDDFDRIVMALQEDAEILTRVVRAPAGESLGELSSAAARANKVLTFGAGGAIALVDVGAFAGGGVVELVPADGSVTSTKLSAAVQPLINGALQRSGGTMTGAMALAGDAANPLEAVPLQQAQSLATAAAAAATTGLAGVNRLINATFAINQDAFAGGSRTAGQYGHDGWKAGAAGCTYSVTGETATVTAGTLLQIIEGAEVAEGGTYTLSWTGTAQARVDGGAYAASPITVTGKTAGANTTIEFGTGTVTRPQYEAGSARTAFSRRARAIDLVLCQRHYEIGTHWTMGYAPVSGALINAGQPFKVTKRAAPTVTIDLSIEASAVNSFTQDQITPHGFRTRIEGGAVGIVRAAGVFTANARL